MMPAGAGLSPGTARSLFSFAQQASHVTSMEFLSVLHHCHASDFPGEESWCLGAVQWALDFVVAGARSWSAGKHSSAPSFCARNGYRPAARADVQGRPKFLCVCHDPDSIAPRLCAEPQSWGDHLCMALGWFHKVLLLPSARTRSPCGVGSQVGRRLDQTWPLALLCCTHGNGTALHLLTSVTTSLVAAAICDTSGSEEHRRANAMRREMEAIVKDGLGDEVYLPSLHALQAPSPPCERTWELAMRVRSAWVARSSW